jgi:protein-disulfide isomerase
MAFLGPESITAAEAWYCAVDQSKGEEYSKLLYQVQGLQGKASFSKDNLKAYAGQLKLNTADFGACLDSGKYNARVLSERQAGENAKVEATPTLIIDGKMFKGALAPTALDSEIQAALKKRGQ